MIYLADSALSGSASLVAAVMILGAAFVVRRATKRLIAKSSTEPPQEHPADAGWGDTLGALLMSSWGALGLLLLWTLLSALNAIAT